MTEIAHDITMLNKDSFIKFMHILNSRFSERDLAVYNHTGPAFTRLFPIGPHATPTNSCKVILSVDAACVAPARAAVPTGFYEWGQLSSKMKVNSAFLTSSFIIIRFGIITVVMVFDVWYRL